VLRTGAVGVDLGLVNPIASLQTESDATREAGASIARADSVSPHISTADEDPMKIKQMCCLS
jgi:hypothetical protein